MVTLIEAVKSRKNELISGRTFELEKDIYQYDIEITPDNFLQTADYEREFGDHAIDIYLGILQAYDAQQKNKGRSEAVGGLIEGIKYVYGIENIPRALRTTIFLVD